MRPRPRSFVGLMALALAAGPALGAMEGDATIGSTGAVPTASDLDLRGAVAAAYRQLPEAAHLQALQEEAGALQRRGEALLSAAPSVSGSYQSDAPMTSQGFVEMETGITLPLRRPGERAADQAVGRQAGQVATAASTEARLRVAGDVREAVWQIALAENELALARQALEAAQRLQAAVERRVALGDLARSDRLLAQNERLSKEAAVTEAEGQVRQAYKAYASLTGLDAVPTAIAESRSEQEAVTLDHPGLAAEHARVLRAQAERRLVRESAGGTPTVSVRARRERGSDEGEFVNSLGVGVTVPFGGGAHSDARIAKTATAVADAESARARQRRELRLSLEQARQALTTTRRALEVARMRRERAEENLGMHQAAFRAGEVDLMDLLRVQADTQEARRQARRRGIELQRAIARYNQAVGDLP